MTFALPVRALRGLLLGVGMAWAGTLAAQDDSPTLNRIRETGVVTVGHRVISAPFSYLDERRRPVGYSMDLCDRIVQAIRTRLQRPDIETRLLARRQSDLQRIDDLRGRTVATTLSTTSIQFLTWVNRELALDMRVFAGSDNFDAFNMVRTGRAVAFAMDDVLLRSLIADAADGHEYSILQASLTTEPYAIGLRRGDPAFKWLVDDMIVGLFRSGEIETLYRRWFESVILRRNVDLRLPMSAALKRVIAQPTDSPDPSLYR